MNLPKVKQQIIDLIKSRLNDIVPGTECAKLYEDTINAMSATELEHWIIALENGVKDVPELNKPATTINLIVPNLSKTNRLDIKRNLALAKKMGHSFFERVWLTNPVTGQVTLTNKRYMSMLLPIRRQAQTLDHKMSLPEGDNRVDDLTGQVTGASKGSSISFPEVQMLDARGLTNTIYELMKPRGGDEEAWRLMKHRLLTTGTFNSNELDGLDSVAKVNKAFSAFLNGMHIRNNLIE